MFETPLCFKSQKTYANAIREPQIFHEIGRYASSSRAPHLAVRCGHTVRVQDLRRQPHINFLMARFASASPFLLRMVWATRLRASFASQPAERSASTYWKAPSLRQPLLTGRGQDRGRLLRERCLQLLEYSTCLRSAYLIRTRRLWALATPRTVQDARRRPS